MAFSKENSSKDGDRIIMKDSSVTLMNSDNSSVKIVQIKLKTVLLVEKEETAQRTASSIDPSAIMKEIKDHPYCSRILRHHNMLA